MRKAVSCGGKLLFVLLRLALLVALWFDNEDRLSFVYLRFLFEVGVKLLVVDVVDFLSNLWLVAGSDVGVGEDSGFELVV